jgi:hypothetical protein
MSEKTKDQTEDLRRAMGTLPELNIENDQTEIHVGVEGIEVELFDCTRNPYRAIFEAAVATWGPEAYPTMWPKVSPENRFKVVKAALTGQTLPQALEPTSFEFIVRKASRSSFDQHARQRVGAAFFSQGVRDNSRLAAGFRLPSELAPENGGDPVLYKEIIAHVAEFKRLYKKILQKGHGSFQSARCIFPMGCTHQYKFAVNLGALKAYCAQRLKACEQADTVQVAILVREEIRKRFPLIASVLKPGCDFSKKCQYHQAYTLSEYFSCLFSGCGRWPDTKGYSTFNSACSSYAQMAKESGVLLPAPKDWEEFETFGDLHVNDAQLFEEGR